MNETVRNDIIGSARKLLSSAFRGVLATHSIDHAGYPFGSLLPYSLGRDGHPLLLLSHLAQHTKNLLLDRRCNLTLVESGSGDVQQLTRLSCLADAIAIEDPDPELCRRHFRYYPASEHYYHELNFRFFTLRALRFHCVAGFGAARWIGVGRMRVDNPFDWAEEAHLLERINRQFASRLPRPAALADDAQPPVAVGLDADGVDLRCAQQLFRIALPEPATTAKMFINRLETSLA